MDAGAQAYLDERPSAELHLLDTGHFALEECLPTIAPLIASFVEGIIDRDPASQRGTDTARS